MIEEYVLVIAAVVVLVVGRISLVRRDRPLHIESKVLGLLLLLALGALIGAGGVALVDVSTRALGVSIWWGVAVLAAVAVAVRVRRSRRVGS